MADNLDTSTKLAMLLAALGNSIGRSSNDAGGIIGGVTQGANDFFAGYGAYNKLEQDAAEKKAMLAYHEAQGRRLDAQTAMEAEKQRLERAGIEAFRTSLGGGAPPTGIAAPGTPPTPGFNVPTPTPTIGPGAAVFAVPDQFKDVVAKAAATHGVAPELIASTIYNESRWNPNAINPNDQRGSINPATGAPYHSVGIGQWGEQWAAARGFDPRDPNASINETAKVMREYTDKYGGNPLLARLAYGWGPGNVDAWLKAGGDPNKVPDGAKVWLPRTAFGIADDNEARAAFARIADKLKPGITPAQFNTPAPPPVSLNEPLALNPDGSPVVRPNPAAGMSVRVPDAVPAPAQPATPPVGQQPGSNAPPSAPPVVPLPTQLLPEEINQLRNLSMASGMTREKLEAARTHLLERRQATGQAIANAAWQAEQENVRHGRGVDEENKRNERRIAEENKRFQRGLETEGRMIRGADGVNRWVPKSQLTPGMIEADKPPEPGSEAGDLHILATADPGSQEYAAAHARIGSKFIDGPNGQKFTRNMGVYPPPTYQAAPPAAAPPAPAGGAPTAQPPSGAPPAAGTPSGVIAQGQPTYTESQNKDHTYAGRLSSAVPQLAQKVTAPDGSYTVADLPTAAEMKMAFSKWAPESQITERAKQYRTIVQDILTAALRRESGATIGESEFVRDMQKYIPTADDSPEVVAIKLKALRINSRGIAEGSGRPLTTYGNAFDEPARQWPTPPQAAIDILKANKDRPGDIGAFNKHFGPGAAEKILGGR